MPPKGRRDPYGRPLPTLAPAPRQDLLHTPQNEAMRHYLLRLLEDDYRAMCTRGTYADITVRMQVKDGTLQPDVAIEVTHHHRYQAEE